DARPRLRAELAALAGQLPALPSSREDTVALARPEDSRIRQLLGQLVTVRRVDPQTSLLGPSQRQAALAAIALQLELAQAALAKPDEEAFTAALDRVEHATPGLFDTHDAGVTRWLERLAALRHADLSPDLPALGATLRELRGLRAVRQVGMGDALRLPTPEAGSEDAATAPDIAESGASAPPPAATGAAAPEASDGPAGDEEESLLLPELEVEPDPGVRP
ncbi:uroporphyrinogen-III C-methyltransferase, partial [Xanthomonadaceae bacterium JHOS43]|nr:uroporphyrinogen-III C-methyltransferase [Xanthomonadaceae bacterium JHOS43]